MSYKFLPREIMVSLSETWVDQSHADCRALKADPIAASIWPFIVEVHERLLALQRIEPTPVRLQEIMKLEELCDGRHDDIIRAFWYLSIAAEYLFEDEADKERIRQLRKKALPDKLMATQRSYRGEVGQARLLASRLTAEDWALMRQIPTPDGGTLADVVNQWFELAAKLGELEYERTGDPSYDQPTQGEILSARHAWIRVVRTLRGALQLRSELPPALQSIMRRIDDVVEQAMRRRASSSNASAEPEPDDELEVGPEAEVEPGPGVEVEAEPAAPMTGAASASEASHTQATATAHEE